MTSSSSTLSRRHFLKASAPLILGSGIIGHRGAVGANGKVRLACIGVGGMGTGNLKAFLNDERVQVVAICDVDAQHRAAGAKLAGLKDSDTFADYKQVLGRTDVDAIMNATPDHWHSHIILAAAAAGKDLYSEKPLAASIGEGRAVCDAISKHGRILQCGTWRRSRLKARIACELVRNGRIGDLKEIQVGVPGKFAIRGGYTGLEAAEAVPAHFDYARWLGPAPERPYTAARCHFNFRWCDDYAPGYITDWGAHFLDVAQWGAGMDDTTPVEVSATEVTRRDKGIYDAAESFRIEYRYANGVKVVMASTTDQTQWGTKFIGSTGWIMTENEKLEASDINILRDRPKDGIKLFESKDHHKNFIDAVLTRDQVAAPAETAHRAASFCHLGTISAALGKPLTFDPKSERFTDEAANAMLTKKPRAGWVG